MQLIDLYTGYEGCSEICLVEETSLHQEVFKVRLLEFHFDEILSLIPLGQYHPSSVMYNYFHAEGWHHEKWHCSRVQEFHDQLVSVAGSVPAKYNDNYNALIDICQSTLQDGNNLYINLY